MAKVRIKTMYASTMFGGYKPLTVEFIGKNSRGHVIAHKQVTNLIGPEDAVRVIDVGGLSCSQIGARIVDDSLPADRRFDWEVVR